MPRQLKQEENKAAPAEAKAATEAKAEATPKK